MPEEYLTTQAFNLWAHTLDRRLDVIEKHGETLSKIEVHLAVLNGRTSANTDKVEEVEEQLKSILVEDQHIETIVTNIQTHGCDQKRDHEKAIVTLAGSGAMPNQDGVHPLSPRSWSPKAKVAAGAGVTALVIPAVSDLFKLGVALIGWLQHLHEGVR